MTTLTSGQTEFARQLARKTGLNSRVIASWMLAEESGGAAKQREQQGNNNWLNIGYFDSGPGSLTKDKVWSDPAHAAAATADFLKGTRYGASPGIRKILGTAGGSQGAQIAAIAGSGWASSGYHGGNTLRQLLQQAPAPGAAGSPNSSGATGSPSPASSPEAAPAQPSVVQQSEVPDLAGLLGQIQASEKPPAPQSMGVAPPAFSAAPTLPQGYQAPASGGGPALRGDGLASMLRSVSETGTSQVPPVGTGGPTATAARLDGGGAPAGGRVKGAKSGDPVVGGTSIGGTHETMGLPGYPARDYFAKAGSLAVAPVTGKVIKLSGHDPKNGPTNGPHGPLGWSVYIKGSDGRTYFLTHLGSRTVKVGQKIEAGAEIGTVANYDKYGTPSHIHMGVQGR